MLINYQSVNVSQNLVKLNNKFSLTNFNATLSRQTKLEGFLIYIGLFLDIFKKIFIFMNLIKELITIKNERIYTLLN